MVLATSDEAALCHVETANLDGETNLKIKFAFDGTKTVTTADQLMDFEDRWDGFGGDTMGRRWIVGPVMGSWTLRTVRIYLWVERLLV